MIDSAVLDKDGNYRFELKGVAKTPSLYNIIYNGERIPLFLAGGEKLSLNSVGSVVRNYTVEGSKESELLRQFYQAFVSGAQRLDNIASQFAKATLSPYLQSLMGEIARMDARISLSSQITEAGYPDLELSDIYGKKVRLSSLAGKVVLLAFWSAELGNSNTLNAELKEVYKKYADAPVAFEVYQVAIDTSKPLWISAVQEQQLPWVSVSDLRGRASSSLGLYNVQKLPANFLIDKEGNIVGKDIYGKSLEQKLDELTR